MFLDHFSGSDLCRLMKRNLLFIPGGFYHSFFFLLHIPCSFSHHKSHAVDQSDLHRNLFSQIYIHCFPGNKFWLHCCNCFSGTGNRQLIPHLRSILFFHSRKCQKFHEPPDKCGFARPNRSYHSKKELPLRTGLYIFVDSKWLHIKKSSSPILLLSICEKNFL